MSHQALTLKPGVDLTETPALNMAGVSSCNLIRATVDPGGPALIQKLGGWSRYFGNTIAAKVRALWGWEDLSAITHLAVGSENLTSTFQAQLSVITSGSQSVITPRQITDNITAAAAATSGSTYVVITDATTQNITQYDTVYIPAHISVGGVILFGLYACDPDGHLAATTYTVQARDVQGNPLAATATTAVTTVASFATTSGQSTVTVTLANHGYAVGDTYPVLISTTVGGVTLYGNYIVQSVTSSSVFTITGPQQASATTSGGINGGKARYIYGFGVGSIPAGTGFGVGGFGTGGFGTGTAITPSTGTPISAQDWTLDNWGEILLVCPVVPPVVLTTTGASGTGVTATITYSQSYTPEAGAVIVVSGVTPTTWNGTYRVTAATSGSVSFTSALTSAITVQGTITVLNTALQPIYQYDPLSGAPSATVIPQAPPVNDGFFVAMPERQIVTWGSTVTGIPDPLLVRWCDLNDFTVWIGDVTNQAGEFRIPRGSKIMGGMQGPQQGLIWTDLSLWTMQYINQPLVYSFNEVGTGCGLIGRKAAGALSGEVYWMGQSQFFVLGPDGVQPLPCTVWDAVFQTLDTTYAYKIRAAPNSRFGEIAWYYPTLTSGGEVAAYVKYNTYTQTWDYGSLARSAWIDQSVLGAPIGADPSSLYIYQHETSPDADGQPLLSIFRTGYFAVAEGDVKAFIDQVWPDMKWGLFGGSMNATVNITFYVTDYPGQTPRTYGPYAVTSATTLLTPRIRGRLIAIEVGSTDIGSFWRLGRIRYRAIADGKY